MMEVSKVLLYCTKAKPYLYEVSMMQYCGTEYGDCVPFGEKLFFITSNNPIKKGDVLNSDFEKQERNYPLKDDLVVVSDDLNGSVCFECDCKEAWLLQRHGGFGDNYFSNCSCENIRLQERSCLTDKQFCSYLGTYGYAYHFENVKPIDPMPITQLYKDEACTTPLTRAPQSYCFAYQKCSFFDKKVHPFPPTTSEMRTFSLQFCTQKEEDRYFYSRKVLIFSIKSPWLALEVDIDPKTGKPYKDLEVKKQCILNAGIEYK